MTDYPASSIMFLNATTFQQMSDDPSVQNQQTDGGYDISRPRYTRRPRRTFSFKYVDMTDSSMNALRTFWELVKGQSNAFNWTHPITGEVIIVRFGQMKMNFTRTGYGAINRWDSDLIVMKEA